jgi:hypothetical protein
MGKLEEMYPVRAMRWAKWRGLVPSQSDFSSKSGHFESQQWEMCKWTVVGCDLGNGPLQGLRWEMYR